MGRAVRTSPAMTVRIGAGMGVRPAVGGWHGGPSGGGDGSGAGSDEFGGGGFGVRRPLRFLAFKLGLDEAQVTGLAGILDELKTERAQAAVESS